VQVQDSAQLFIASPKSDGFLRALAVNEGIYEREVFNYELVARFQVFGVHECSLR
jgi:hypothetical protein